MVAGGSFALCKIDVLCIGTPIKSVMDSCIWKQSQREQRLNLLRIGGFSRFYSLV